jgi:hypothetical protein
VSREFIYRRFFDRGLIRQDDYARAAKRWAEQKQPGGSGGNPYWSKLARIIHHASRFCPLGWRTHAVDPSVWIGVRQLAVQRIGD